MGHLTSSLVHCLKSVRIRTYFGPYFPAFGLHTGRYFVSLGIQSECRKMRTKITPNTGTFHVVVVFSLSVIRVRKSHLQFAFCECIRESCECGVPYIVKITNG